MDALADKVLDNVPQKNHDHLLNKIAGVIFKDKMSVLGLTTAAVIWTAAAIGMTAGIGYYSLAIVMTVITLIILILVSKVEVSISAIKKSRIININFVDDDLTKLIKVEEKAKALQLTTKRVQIYKAENALCAVLEITGAKKNVEQLNLSLLETKEIKDFH